MNVRELANRLLMQNMSSDGPVYVRLTSEDVVAIVRAAMVEALEAAACTCAQIGARGSICDEPEVLERLHVSESSACIAAIEKRIEEISK